MRALDPRRVLERGYTVTRDADGRVVRSATGTEAGAVLETEFARGRSDQSSRTHHGGSGVTDEAIGYADAMTELAGILDELERDDLDVDVLAERVKRASELIKLCRDRISRAQDDVDRIVTDLESFDGERSANEGRDDDTA